jgi:MATE family multidrug resistance protein
MPAATHMVSYTLVMVPLAYVFAIRMAHGVDGIIWAVIIASLMSASLLWGRFAWLARQSGRARRPAMA